MSFDNIESVKELYKEILIKRHSWENFKTDEDHNTIIVRYELHQGGHHAYGWPIVFWKYTNYPVKPTPPKRKIKDVLGSIYAQIKERFSIYRNN